MVKQPKARKSGSGAKRPAVAAPVGAASKRPATAPASAQHCRYVRFRWDRLDVGGPWCISAASAESIRLLLRKLREFERMTVNEVFHSSSSGPGRDYRDLHLCPNRDVLERLRDLQMDDIDALSRLRLGGTERLFGVRCGNEFSVLWWDPFHQVWPSRLKHT